MKLSEKQFGMVADDEIIQYTIENSHGVKLSAMNYGATLTALEVPDKQGKLANVVLGFDSAAEYQQHGAYFGATVGRVAGRIKQGQFQLHGTDYQLSQNDGDNHLHGGGLFNAKVWQAETYEKEAEAGIIFTATSPAGECGYPGNLAVQVTFALTEDNQWKLHYQAKTDEATLFNPTNHVYFNLSGDYQLPILEHQLTLVSERFAALQADSIPTGELEEVTGTDFDFRRGKAIQAGATSKHPQNALVKGYDHAFVLAAGDLTVVKGELVEPQSGRRLRLYTDSPSVVVYSGNQLHGEFLLGGTPVIQYAGITLETQGLPDAINQQGFGSIVLEPNEVFESETIYQFDLI